MNLFTRTLIAVGLTLGAFGQALANDKQIKIVSDFWFPYNGAPTAAQKGYVIDLARQIAAKQGYTIDYRLGDRDEAAELASSGNIDCIVGTDQNESAKLAFPKHPWGISVNAAYTLNDAPNKPKTLAEATSLRVGAIDGYTYNDEIERLLAKSKSVHRTPASPSAFTSMVQRLVVKKLDVVIEDVNVANAAINKLQLSGRVVPTAVSADRSEVFLACTANERGKALVKMFDEGLTAARANGSFAKVLGNYGLSDWVASAARPAAATRPQ